MRMRVRHLIGGGMLAVTVRAATPDDAKAAKDEPASRPVATDKDVAELVKGQKVLMTFHAYPVGKAGPGQDNTAARKKVAEEIKAAIEKAGASVVKVLRDDDGEARSIHLWLTLLIDCGRADPNEAMGKLPNLTGGIVFQDGRYVRGLADPADVLRREPMAAAHRSWGTGMLGKPDPRPSLAQLRAMPGIDVQYVPPPMGSGGSMGYALISPAGKTTLLEAFLAAQGDFYTSLFDVTTKGTFAIRDGGREIFAVGRDRKTVLWTAKPQTPARLLVVDGRSVITLPDKWAFDLETGKSKGKVRGGTDDQARTSTPPTGELTREKLIEIANEEAKKAWRKQHNMAADAVVGDFDRPRKPDGAVYDTRVEADGENQRVIFTVSLTIAGRTTVNRTEVVLDKAGKVVGEVKFATLKDAAGGMDGGAASLLVKAADMAGVAQSYAAKIKPLLPKGWDVSAEKNLLRVKRAEPVEWYGTISLPNHKDKAELKARGFVQSGAYTITAELAAPMMAEQAAAIAKENDRISTEYFRAHPRPANAKPTAPPKELTDQLKPVPNVLVADCSVMVTSSVEPPLAFYDDAVAAECEKVLRAVRGVLK